jgi:phosphate transport system permease protein
MSVYIWHVNSEGLGSFVAQIANGTSAILILTVLIFNLGARGLGRALQRRVTGA